MYHCKHCDARGNVYTFMNKMFEQFLEKTTNEHYMALSKKRSGVSYQTFGEAHQWAYDEDSERWLIPYRNNKGSIVTIQEYFPSITKNNKRFLPGLPSSLYGLHLLPKRPKANVILCEGPFDAVALDWNIGARHRDKYVILGVPGSFKKEWAQHLHGRKVRLWFDNDDGGKKLIEQVKKPLCEGDAVEEIRILKWPEDCPDGCDLNDLVTDPHWLGKSVIGYLLKNSLEVTPEPKFAWRFGWERGAAGQEHIDWIWPDRLRCGTYASFSGKRGTLKSTIVRELVARYTRGKLMPDCKTASLPAGHVIYITAEDSETTTEAGLEYAGADKDRLIIHGTTMKDGEFLNILEHLHELRQVVRQYGVRLVVIDGQNSVVGAPCIATDMLARHNITNKLHQFAQQENICLLGIRNEDAEGRAYGPASMSDLSRCILRAEEIGKKDGQRYFKLVFERISDAAPSTHPDLYYSVKDLGGQNRKILWGVNPPKNAENSPKEAVDHIKKSLAAKQAKGKEATE
jgi:hypothetical protein